MIWQELTQPAVRDLAWACFSPPLLISSLLPGAGEQIENCQLDLTPAREKRLRLLDKDPGQLLGYLADNNHTRLGIYYETLWHFFLDTDPDTELLAHNLPVREGGRTLGEFDILYLCKQTGRHIHLELAVKFYLGLPGSDIWLGPGQRDRLDRKIAHLTGRQIRLGALPQAQSQLQALGIETLSRQIELKGYLFSREPGATTLPRGYNREAPLSSWHSIGDFHALAARAAQGQAWCLVPRDRWLSPLWNRELSKAVGVTALLTQLHDNFRSGAGPQVLACCDPRGREMRRCFVTPEAWPARAAELAQ